MRTYNKISGFSLIELMITVAVVGILAAIALPAFQDQIRKGRRAEAQSVLLNVGAKQQQMLLDTRIYTNALPTGITVPSSVQQNYTIAVAAPATTASAPVPTFSATATPIGGQAADKCGVMSINEVGTKAGATPGCW